MKKALAMESSLRYLVMKNWSKKVHGNAIYIFLWETSMVASYTNGRYRKIAWDDAKNYLNCLKGQFPQIALSSMWLLFNHHDLPLLSGHYNVNSSEPMLFQAISSEPMLFQVNPCYFKWTHAISSEPMLFQVNPCYFKWTHAISSKPMSSLEIAWVHLKLHGFTWNSMGSLEIAWVHLK